MEFETFLRKRNHLLIVLLVLVASTISVKGGPYRLQGNLTTLDQTTQLGDTDEQTIGKYLDRAIVSDQINKKWAHLTPKYYTQSGNAYPKVVEFKTSSGMTLSEIFHYLQYFPLLETGPVKYKIPVDGQEINLKLEPHGKGKFTAKYLYKDQNGQTVETDLSKVESNIHSLIDDKQFGPELKNALETSLPKIFKESLSTTDTFKTHLTSELAKNNKPNIPDDVKARAFRQAMEVMISSSVLRKNPHSWIGEITTKMKQSSRDLKVKHEVQKKWNEWRNKNFLTESTDLHGVKSVRFDQSATIPIKEVFHILKHFPLLESGPVRYYLNIAGKENILDLSPDGNGGFKAKSVYSYSSSPPAPKKRLLETDLSQVKPIVQELHTDTQFKEDLRLSLFESFPRFFEGKISDINRFDGIVDSNTQLLYEIQKKAVEKKQKLALKKKKPVPPLPPPPQPVPDDLKDRAFRETFEVLSASYLTGQDLVRADTPQWLKRLDNEFETMTNELERELQAKVENPDMKTLEEDVKKKWKNLKDKNLFTESSDKALKKIKFEKSAHMTLIDVFYYLEHFPMLEKGTVVYEIPVDGKTVTLKLEPDGSGKFKAKYLYPDPSDPTGNNMLETDLSNVRKNVEELIGENARVNSEIQKSLESTLPEIINQGLDQNGVFEKKLKSKIAETTQNTGSTPQITDNDKNKAFRQSMEAVASALIFGNSPNTWIEDADKYVEEQRNNLENTLTREIESIETTKLRYELTASIRSATVEARQTWEDMKSKGHIIENFSGKEREILIKDTTPLSLLDTFRLLQHYNHLYPEQGQHKVKLRIPIGGKERTIYISKASKGESQIFIESKDSHWSGSTAQGKTPNSYTAIKYTDMIEGVLSKFHDQPKLAETMLKAIHGKLNEQPDFNTELEVSNDRTATLDTIRTTVELLLTTMVAEAAALTKSAKSQFQAQLAETSEKLGRFPDATEMPNLEQLGPRMFATDPHIIKAGRSPTAEQVMIDMLHEIYESQRSIKNVITSKRYPHRHTAQGTAKGRKYTYAHGDDKVAKYILRKRASSDHDGETIAKRVRKFCTGSGRRKKRSACSLEDIDNKMIVDDKSIRVEDTKVVLDIVDRRDATKRKTVEIKITPDELATPKLVEENVENSKRAGVSQKYAKINRGLAVHGLIFSAIGAIDYFKTGDDVKGGIAVAQSLHTLGGLTGLNEIASKATKKVLRHAAFKIAKGLNMEKGLETFSAKVEKYMEKGVGKLMGDLPGVGLAFDIYFIEQDFEQLAQLDLNKPEDVKMLPLRIVDLVLDVDTTVLNLIGTFCPEAEVITEPLIIVLSIVRMAIDDFYIDIMEEMDKVNWRSPWAGLEFIGALFKGIVEGVADFLSGGLRRQMEMYSKQEKADQNFLTSLKDASSYFKIKGKVGGKQTIDFTQGKLSSYGGFINFRMLDGKWKGYVELEIGDVTGKHKTIKPERFYVGKDVTDIVLGIGESREFLYTKKTAKLWMIIPIKHYEVIDKANLKSSSLHGIYYGNSEDNKFYAVQKQKEEKAKKNGKDKKNPYGQINIKFVTGHYHYNLYGKGGNDVFYLGPQASHVTGGQGRDVYIVQSYGGNTIIDNFSEDNKRDMVIINVPYQDITCTKNNIDLDILYKNTHHIRINNWFVPGNPNYYRHISFRSSDGIIFVAKDLGGSVKCKPIAITKGSQGSGENIQLNSEKFSEVKQVVGTNFNDNIYGNDLNNILDGGKGKDTLSGGRGEDTYIIRPHEGCDTINNNADDYKTTTDVLIFAVPYKYIAADIIGKTNLVVFDYRAKVSRDSCVLIDNWVVHEKYRHMIFTSSDHVVFKIKTYNNEQRKFPMVLDYSSSAQGVKVALSDKPVLGFITNKGFDQVATVSDSKYDDGIIGNKQSNFLSCTGGTDMLSGRGGSDNYVVKKSCKLAKIINLDPKEKVDLLLLDYNFSELSVKRQGRYDLLIQYDVVHTKVVLGFWYLNSQWRHLWVRTKDGITLNINGEEQKLEPVEISKDPVECQCKATDCKRTLIRYDLNKDPWKKVTRFQLNSSYCSYHIKGNHLNNYIDPGSGNGYNFQHLEGRLGADTYVLKHGYGEFNIIKNHAQDNKTDVLKLGLELNDISFSFYGKYDVVLGSKSRPSSLTVRIKDYFKSHEYQHLQVMTSDQVIFEIQNRYPFMKNISLDRTLSDSPQTIRDSKVQTLLGAKNYRNVISGTSVSRVIDGGSVADDISGGPGNNIIDGKSGNDRLVGEDGNDILFGGDGDDIIKGGDGNDYIYGGDGKDDIDGGAGGDTMAFKGDGYNKKGVYIDLSAGFGRGADAEGDTYKGIEHVYGTIHNDTIVGSNSNNNLYGRYGDDVIIAKGGYDKLVGGEGSDRYILEGSSGVKVINNYAKGIDKDIISLSNFDSKDACFFMVGNDLHVQVERSSLNAVLSQNTKLTIVVQNWGTNYHYRHMHILFKDRFLQSRRLAEVRHQFKQLKSIADHMKKDVNLTLRQEDQYKNVSLSWSPIPLSPLDEKFKITLFQVDIDNPQNSKSMEIVGENLKKGRLVIPFLKKDKHYIFSLFLDYCSDTIASSNALAYYGKQKACQAITVPNTNISYTPTGSYSHGAKASLICAQFYKFNITKTFTLQETCVDGKWQPGQLPFCVPMATCLSISSPSYGNVTVTNTGEGGMATYVCHKGFELIGSQQRFCEESGKWTGDDSKCERVNCLQLPKVKHGSLTKCPGQTEKYGTMEQAKHGFCVKLTCSENYVEEYKVSESSRRKLAKNRIKNRWFCRAGKWKGLGEIACLPAARLHPVTSTWHKVQGTLQEWDDSTSKWTNSLSRDSKLHKLACSNAVGIDRYDETITVESQEKSLRISCSLIRFVNKITQFEGKVQVLRDQKWTPTCLLPKDPTKNNPQLYRQMCADLGLKSIAKNPGIAQIPNGPTTHVLRCESTDVNRCKHELTVFGDCPNMLQCRRRCNNAYPVPNAKSRCAGALEGDKCNVECLYGFRLIGARTVYCKKGVWSDRQGNRATSRCEEAR